MTGVVMFAFLTKKKPITAHINAQADRCATEGDFAASGSA
jgi:hypothetical protein